MYVKGNHITDHLVESVKNYELKGKADLVFQNTGETDVRIGIRTLKPKDTYRMAGELTILQNNPVSIVFIDQGAETTNSLYAHYILPKSVPEYDLSNDSC